MIFNLVATPRFSEQVENLDGKDKRIIESKLDLIKLNPYRFKSLHSKRFSKVFRVRPIIQNKETRLFYVVLEPNIIMVCLLGRKDDYRDLEKYLGEV